MRAVALWSGIPWSYIFIPRADLTRERHILEPTFRTKLCPCFDGVLIAGRRGVARDLRGAQREAERQQALLLGWPTLGRHAGTYRSRLKRVVTTRTEQWDRGEALRGELEQLAVMIDHLCQEEAPPLIEEFPIWFRKHVQDGFAIIPPPVRNVAEHVQRWLAITSLPSKSVSASSSDPEQVGRLCARVDPSAVERVCGAFLTKRFVGSSPQAPPIEALSLSPDDYERGRMKFARVLCGNLCDCSAEWIKRRLQPRHRIANTTVVNVDLNELQAVAGRRL